VNKNSCNVKVVKSVRINPKINAIGEVLIRRGWSKSDLGEQVGIGAPYAIQICNGARNPGPKTARKICEALEVGFDDIFEIVKPGQPESQATAK